MRRLIRRAITTARTIGLRDEFFAPLVAELGVLYARAYPETVERGDEILGSLLREEKTFRRSLEGGLRALKQFEGGTLTGADIFMLSDTFGFPREITIEESRKLNIDLSQDWELGYRGALRQQRERSRGSSKLGTKNAPQ